MENSNVHVYVCFVCELEFKDVSELTVHMNSHSTSKKEEPLDDDLATEEYDEMVPGVSCGESATNDQKFDVENETSANIKKKKSLFDINKTVIRTSKVKSMSTSASVAAQVLENKHVSKKTSKSDNSKHGLNIKPEPIEDTHSPTKIDKGNSSIMQRAMKLKWFIQNQVENTKKRKEQEEIDAETNNANEEDMEEDMAEERVVMVNSSFFDGDLAEGTLGSSATVLNAPDPDGFVIPERCSKFDELSDDESEGIATSSEPFSLGSVNGVKRSMNQGAHVFGTSKSLTKFVGRGSGVRGRRKRGRPRGKDYYMEYMESENVDFDVVSGNGKRIKRERHDDDDDEDDDEGVAFSCTKCHKVFSSWNAMKMHKKTHLENKEIPCPYCHKVFSQRYLLHDHLLESHSAETMNIICPICSKVFASPDSLKSHMVRLHEEGGGLSCYICGKNFPGQGQLEIHLRIHTGERPFKCEICSKRFVQKVHLNTHLRSMHSVTDGNLTPCRICDRMFSGRNTLREHYVKVHRMSSTQYKNEVYRLRKEGRIPDTIPPKVAIVDPSFRYTKVDVKDIDDDADYVPPSHTMSKLRKIRKGATSTRSSSVEVKSERAPGMGTILNTDDDIMFSHVSFEPKARDKEELNLVESAFKVAEEMDQLQDGNSAIIMTDETPESAIYYSIPIDMADEEDEEYADFAAEHAHINDSATFEVIDADSADSGNVIIDNNDLSSAVSASVEAVANSASSSTSTSSCTSTESS